MEVVVKPGRSMICLSYIVTGTRKHNFPRILIRERRVVASAVHVTSYWHTTSAHDLRHCQHHRTMQDETTTVYDLKIERKVEFGELHGAHLR